MSKPSVVEQYWQGVAAQLQIEAEVFSQLVEHNGERGRANEIALGKLFSRLVPSQYEVGTGLVIDSEGNKSNQIDLIIYERTSQPQILAQSSQLLFPVETVRLAIEVKTTITSKEIKDVGKKVRSLNMLKPKGSDRPAFALFSYRIGNSVAGRAEEFDTMSDGSRPDAICVLTPGLVTSPRDGSKIAFVPRHIRNEAGEALSLQWERTTEQGSVVRDSTKFPVARMKMNGKEKYVFDPGRALLIFASRILELLSIDSQTWLNNYLTETAKEVVQISDLKNL